MLRIFVFLLFISSSILQAQTIKIKVLEKGSGQPLENVLIQISPFQLSAYTNAKGEARFDQLPKERMAIRFSSLGYAPLELKEVVADYVKEIEVELQPVAKSLEGLEIIANTSGENGRLNVESITREQIFRFPATFFDPARLVMSFPGVVNTNDQANNISVRGNSPDFNQWKLEGVEIVNPNHLSNAGTFSDKSTSNGGGTNILSAQMLGNMQFLSGGYSSSYGNALSGVFDMNLRKGNAEKYEHVVQAGLLGIDLSSEGPLNKKKGSSYLFNYRYSFTGLLGAAGVNFGGEKITFQDIALTLNFPTQKAGNFKVFGMAGNSSNLFTPEEDSSLWESSKDLSHIDYYGRMGLIGLSHSIPVFRKWNLKTVIVNSALENLRNAYAQNTNVDYDYFAKNYASGSTTLSGNVNAWWNMKAGVNVSHQYHYFNIIDSDELGYYFLNTLVQPFLEISNRIYGKWNYQVGFMLPYYSLSNSQYLEPRAQVQYALASNQTLEVSYGLHSQLMSGRVAMSLPYKPLRSHHYNLAYKWNFNSNQSIKAQVYYQSIFNLLKFDHVYMSVLNGFETGDFRGAYYDYNQKKQGRNYGLELSYQHLLNKGWFALLNTTLYKSEFKAFDQKFYDTRFSGRYIANFTVGKEWNKNKGRIWGANLRINQMGGLRDYEIETEPYPYFNLNQPLRVQYKDYFRTDVRVYLKRHKIKTTETLSLDLQNLSGQQNSGFFYYDSWLQNVVEKKQQGLVPMLNYRWEF